MASGNLMSEAGTTRSQADAMQYRGAPRGAKPSFHVGDPEYSFRRIASIISRQRELVLQCRGAHRRSRKLSVQ